MKRKRNSDKNKERKTDKRKSRKGGAKLCESRLVNSELSKTRPRRKLNKGIMKIVINEIVKL